MTGNQSEETIQNIKRKTLIKLIFGDIAPGLYTKITFYIALIAFVLHFIWSIFCLITVTNVEWISEKKNIDIANLFDIRGLELGFSTGQFIEYFYNFTLIAIILFVVQFYGLILLWKRKVNWVYYFFGSMLLYISLLFFFLGFTYWKEDLSFFDKTVYFTSLLHTLLYYFVQRGQEDDGERFLFGED